MVLEDCLPVRFDDPAQHERGCELDIFDEEEESETESDVSENDSVLGVDDLDSLLGITVTTVFGAGVVEDIHSFEDIEYCTIRLMAFGTLSMAFQDVETLLRKERKFAPPQRHSNGSRFQNLRGTIRMYNPAKGWGFIVCDEFDGDVFLHSKHMVGTTPLEYIGHFQSSQEGHQVRFDLDLQHRSRPQALNVRVVGLTEQKHPVYPKRKRNRLEKLEVPESENAEDDGWQGADSLLEASLAEEGSDLETTSETDVHPSENIEASAEFAESCRDPSAEVAAEADESKPQSEADLVGIDWFYSAADEAKPRAMGGTTDWFNSAGLPFFMPREVVQRKGILRMRGLPFSATAADIANFFIGYGVRQEDVVIGRKPDGSLNGLALVLFARDELAEKARKEKHMQHMGHRYIELINAKPSPNNATDQEGSIASPHVRTDESTQVAIQSPASCALEGGHPPHQPSLASFLACPTNPPPVPVQANPTSAAVIAGAVPPPPGAAAAASSYAAYAAAVHASHTSSPTPTAPPSHETTGIEGQLYQQYFQYFQQAYATAIASQQVQAYAAEAARHYQEQLQQQLPPAEKTVPVEVAPVQSVVVGDAEGGNFASGDASGLGVDFGTPPVAVPPNKAYNFQSPPMVNFYGGVRAQYYNEI